MAEVNKYFKKLGDMFPKNQNEFLKLIPNCKQLNYNEISMIYKAFYKAIELHDGQFRKTGAPYISHPIAVAGLLAGFGFDYEMITAALLHDTIEDTEYTLNECEKEFGEVIATLVDGVTKIGTDVNEPTHQKIIDAAHEDVRTIAIKSGDRLHNLYTLEALKEEKQKEIATETEEFYIPISKILGIYKLKDEFQDLCTFYLDRQGFIDSYEKRQWLKKKCGPKCTSLADKTMVELSKHNIAMSYNYRIKNTGAIHEELRKSNNVKDIKDLLAIKMILKEQIACYEALGIVHSLSKPLEGTFEDFIANPKTNGYQSLNTNVKYNDANMQIRIRTEKMQGTNDLGVFSNLNDDAQKMVSEKMKDDLNKLVKKRR